MIEAPVWWFIVTIIVAALGVVVAVYRGLTEQKQQIAAKQGLLDERFKMAVELVRSENMAARVRGLYVLADMARLYPEYNHVRVMEIFIALLPRRLVPTERISSRMDDVLYESRGADVTAIKSYIESRGEVEREIERRARFSLKQRLNYTEYIMDGRNLILRRDG